MNTGDEIKAAPHRKPTASAFLFHPDDKDVPVSLVHIPLSRGRYAILYGPLGRKTLEALQGTLEACKEILVKPESIDDYDI
jgi:hypothetical protein